jgi:hypothetical protein
VRLSRKEKNLKYLLKQGGKAIRKILIVKQNIKLFIRLFQQKSSDFGCGF